MRTIDADAFDRCLADAQSECKKNGGNFRYGMLNQVRGNLAEQPTIDAIPVEWLEMRRFETSYKGAEPDIDLNYAFGTVMNEWQKEQK